MKNNCYCLSFISIAALLTLGGAMGSAAPTVDNETQHVVTSFIFMIYWISFLDVLVCP